MERNYFQHIPRTRGSVLLAKQTIVSTVAAIVVAGGIDWQSYSRYEIEIERLIPATNADGLFLRFYQDGGGVTIGANYYYIYTVLESNGGTTSVSTARAAANIGIASLLSNSTTGGIGYNGIITLSRPGAIQQHGLMHQGFASNSTSVNDINYYSGSAVYSGDNLPINGIRIGASSGNILQATIYVRGIV